MREPNTGGAEQLTRWEQIALTRWGKYIREIECHSILEASRLAGEPARALEVGCEGGHWSRMLTDRGWHMTCTDIDTQTLARCQQKIPSASCILMNPQDTKLPCEDGGMRLLVCIEVESVMNSSWFHDEVYRVLEPGGVIVAVAFNSLSLRAAYVRLAAYISGKSDGFYQNPYPRFRRQLQQRGFVMLKEGGYCWFPFWRESNSRLAPIAGKVEQWLGLRKLPALSPWVIFIGRKIGA